MRQTWRRAGTTSAATGIYRLSKPSYTYRRSDILQSLENVHIIRTAYGNGLKSDRGTWVVELTCEVMKKGFWETNLGKHHDALSEAIQKLVCRLTCKPCSVSITEVAKNDEYKLAYGTVHQSRVRYMYGQQHARGRHLCCLST